MNNTALYIQSKAADLGLAGVDASMFTYGGHVTGPILDPDGIC